MSKYKHLNFTLCIPKNYLECDKKEATHYLLMSGETGQGATHRRRLRNRRKE